jgi:hypothetical protein
METIRDRNIRVREILAVAIVAIVGTSLAFQNWKSRIPSGTFFDVVTIIDEAHKLVDKGRVPQKGVLTSFAAFAPPGGVWLMVPGVLLLKEPRLFQSIGSVTLYCGTLVGIFLLTRFHLGSRCALLAVLLWGLSKYGLFSLRVSGQEAIHSSSSGCFIGCQSGFKAIALSSCLLQS